MLRTSGNTAIGSHRERTTLETLRLANGFSRETLGARSHVAARTIYGIEVEGRRPHRLTAMALADALGVDPDELMASFAVKGPSA
jgi:transcriptional regulator with XRE-family HTH domain